MVTSTARAIQRRVKTGNKTCRRRKIKCDERRPQCRHCEIGRRVCIFDSTTERGQSRPGRVRSSPDQACIGYPAEVTFVYHHHQVGIEIQETDRLRSAPTASQVNKAAQSLSGRHVSNGESQQSAAAEESGSTNLDQSFRSPADLDSVVFSPYPGESGNRVDLTLDEAVTTFQVRSLSRSSVFANGPWEPLSDPEDARLFQHYVDNLASWLDLNDPERYFTTFVPHFALRCPMLLSAILSFAASHLSRLDSSCDALIGIDYHNKCIERLIPALADPSLALDPILPLSTVILRMHEMLTYETDQQRHLRGCSSLFAYNRSREMKGTAFWTYIREEILVALPNRSPTNIDTSTWKDEICWEGNTDYVHTNRMTWLAIEVINFCFGDALKTNPAKAIELHHEIDLWRQSLPETFKPLYTVNDGKAFPRISYLCTWHVIGMQFYHMAKVLLALYNPNRASGMDFLELARMVEEDIREHTVQLCGMIKSLGSRHPGALVNGVQPLILCGRSLKNREEQLELVRMLRQIERDTAWPTNQGIQSLQKAWGRQISY
ncbi:hypothetical protein F5884DRAFT_795864 [Xylogone sp. PMI_703]|nr:hypothetical protein F5884DRAFT_795864 [Xylogone sp. PMI_703]